MTFLLTERLDPQPYEKTKPLVIDSDKYEITNPEPIGQGTWGAVFAGRNKYTGEEVAIKVLNPTELAKKQMRERRLNEFTAMANEALELSNFRNVVQRDFNVDRTGTPFIAMPRYDTFLSDILKDERKERACLGNGLSLEEILQIAKGVSNGLAELHTAKISRAHSDLKPDNIAISYGEASFGEALINDLGTATCASLQSQDPRANMGHIYTRAYECFRKGSHPDKQSDVFGFGSLFYRMFSGKYILEDEINASLFPDKMDKETIESLVKKRVNANVPRKFRGLVRKCLSYNPHDRYESAREVSQELEKIIDHLDTKKLIRTQAKKLALALGLPAVGVALCTYLSIAHEPQELTMPKSHLSGLLYGDIDPAQKPVEFESEVIPDLPEASQVVRALSGASTRMAKRATNNRIVAYLTKTHSQTQHLFGGIATDICTEFQLQFYRKTTPLGYQTRIESMPHEIWANAIEYALTQSKIEEGKVDLEDVCAIARLGTAKVEQAKRVSGSLNYRFYRTAKDENGKLIIPKAERTFIDQWISYTHADVD